MNKTPTLTTMLTDLAAWYPTMLEITHPSIQAITYTHAHTTGVKADSQPERAVYTKDHLENELADLTQIAATLTNTDCTNLTLSAVLDILTAHAPAIQAWPEDFQTIERIHSRWKALCEPEEEVSAHTCPACLSTRLRWHYGTKTYRCPACKYSGTLDQVRALQAWRIRQTNTWITFQQACLCFNLTPQALRQHIHCGNLHPTGGLLHTVELRNLPRLGEMLPP